MREGDVNDAGETILCSGIAYPALRLRMLSAFALMDGAASQTLWVCS